MNNLGFIQYEKVLGREKLFFKDNQADFFVLHQEKLYSLRKQFLTPSAYFCRKIQKMHQVHVINENINVKALENVLSCLYGLKCIYQRGKQVDFLMDTIKFIECKDLEQLLTKQIHINFKKYDIFFLLDFAHKYIDQLLYCRCYSQLVIKNFQQFNYNRLDLLNCSQYTFQNLIRLHQRLKKAKKIKGLTFQDLRQIIVEYNRANCTKVDLLTALVPPTALIIFQDPEGQLDSPVIQKFTKLKKYQTINIDSDKSKLSDIPLTSSINLTTQQSPKDQDCILRIQKFSKKQKKIQYKSKLKLSSNKDKFEFPTIFQQTYMQNINESQSSKRLRTQKIKLELQNILKIPKKVFSLNLVGPFTKIKRSKQVNLSQSHPSHLKSYEQLKEFENQQDQILVSKRFFRSENIKKSQEQEYLRKNKKNSQEK